MKKIIAIATSASIALMIAGPAAGATVEELQAQIADLLAQIQTLQTQLTAMGGSSVGAPAACAGITAFTRNLYLGVSGNDVKCLQALLNQSADTQVAASGVGSAGSETTYFGSLTQAAVMKYQAKNGISPVAGYVGPITRSHLDPVLAGGVTPTGTASPTPSGACSGTEGSYTVTLSTTPVSRTVNGGAGIEAYGIDVTAYNSDITVGSIDLQTAVTVAAVAWNPSTFITGIKVYKDSVSDANLVKTISSPVFTLDTASVYYTSLTGINLVVPVGTTVKVLIVIDTVESADNNRVVTLNIYGNGIRGRDCIGIDRFTALANNRQLTVQPASGNATLTVTAAPDNPNSQNIYSNPTTGVTTDTPILVFNARASGGTVDLVRVTVNVATAASDAVPSILYLKQGGSIVQSCSPATGVCTFENFRTPIATEETKKFSVEANWTAMVTRGAYALTGVNIPAAFQGIVYERTNGSQIGTAVAPVLAEALNGNVQYLWEAGVRVTLSSATATGGTIASTQSGVATGIFNFTVQPFGGTLTQFATATPSTENVNAFFVEAYWSSSTTLAVGASATTDSVMSRVLSQTPARDLTDGETGTVQVQSTVTSTTTYGAGTLRFRVEGFQWTVGNNNIYQGEGFIAEERGGNMTDNWFTNWVTVQ